jgi:ATP-dependent DNA ligase
VKVKHRKTTDCVVGGYRVSKDGAGVGSLLLGLYDDGGHLHYVGHTSSFKAAERRELREVLAPLEGGAGFGGEARSPGGQSRWSAGRESDWVSLDPVLVCEVTYERVQGGRFRHSATFVRWREDRDPQTCTFEQVGAEPPSWADV